MSKSNKLYKDSPKLERDDESGKVGIKKPTKADGENIGTEGDAIPGSEGDMPIDVHQAERNEVGKKHVQELKDMHKRHDAEFEAMHKRHSSEKKEPAPAEKINKEEK